MAEVLWHPGVPSPRLHLLWVRNKKLRTQYTYWHVIAISPPVLNMPLLVIKCTCCFFFLPVTAGIILLQLHQIWLIIKKMLQHFMRHNKVITHLWSWKWTLSPRLSVHVSAVCWQICKLGKQEVIGFNTKFGATKTNWSFKTNYRMLIKKRLMGEWKLKDIWPVSE